MHALDDVAAQHFNENRIGHAFLQKDALRYRASRARSTPSHDTGRRKPSPKVADYRVYAAAPAANHAPFFD
jgi:hypothetical protein